MQFRQTFCLFLLFWAFIWVAIRAKAESQPTFAVRLTNPGVKFFSSIGHKLVNKELPKTKFPPISLPINSGPGSGQVDVSDLQILERSFESPKFQFQLVPPNSVKFVSTGGSIPVSGQWSAYYWLAGIKFSTSGWVQLEVDGIQSTISIGISHWKGKPQLDLISCQADISQIDVQIGGGVIPWLVNLFRSSLSAALKQAVHDQFCLIAKTSLLAQLNLLLLSLPTTLTLGDSLFLQYSFDNDTQVTNSYIQSMAFANLLVQNDSGKCPFGPESPMPLLPSSQQWMVSVWLHGSVMNCMFWSIHRANLLQMTISPDFDGGKFAKFLQTSCHIYQICIGRFFPQLSRQFPGQHVDFHFHSASPPNAKFVNSQNATLNLTAQFYVDLHISPWKLHTQALARLQMNATADFEPILDGGKLKGKLGSLEVKFVELSSSIGNFSNKFLNTFALLAKPIVEAALQSSLRAGFPLPTIEGIELANGSQLIGLIDSQQLRLDSNLAYANLTKIGWRNGKKWHRKHFN